MRSLRRLCFTAVLTVSFTLPVLAGDMGGPSSLMNPGDMGGPSSLNSGDMQGPTRATPGDQETPGSAASGVIDNSTLASVLLALQSLIS